MHTTRARLHSLAACARQSPGAGREGSALLQRPACTRVHAPSRLPLHSPALHCWPTPDCPQVPVLGCLKVGVRPPPAPCCCIPFLLVPSARGSPTGLYVLFASPAFQPLVSLCIVLLLLLPAPVNCFCQLRVEDSNRERSRDAHHNREATRGRSEASKSCTQLHQEHELLKT